MASISNLYNRTLIESWMRGGDDMLTAARTLHTMAVERGFSAESIAEMAADVETLEEIGRRAAAVKTKLTPMPRSVLRMVGH